MQSTWQALEDSAPIGRASQARSPLSFCLLVFALSVPLWIAGAITGLQLFPGLPLAALGVVCPAAAALILVYREKGVPGVRTLLKRCLDYNRIRMKGWYAPIVLLMPAVTVVSYALQRMMGSTFAPLELNIPVGVTMFFVFLVSAMAEEIGWSGYATDPLQDRSSALQAGILLGVVWAVWHVAPLAQAHRSAAWITCWSLGTVSLRVILVWLYNNTGKSVFAAALFHAIGNVCTVLFAAYYNPAVTSLTIATAAVIITAVWGPRTLARWNAV